MTGPLHLVLHQAHGSRPRRLLPATASRDSSRWLCRSFSWVIFVSVFGNHVVGPVQGQGVDVLRAQLVPALMDR